MTRRPLESFLEQTIDSTVASEELAEAIHQAYVRARAVRPAVELSETAFAAHLGAVLPEGDDVVAALQEVRTDDLYLACACATGAATAVRAFEDEIIPKAAAAAARVDSAPHFVSEVCGDVRIKLLVAEDGRPGILGYLGRGPLAHWVQVVAMRTAQTHKRKAKRRDVPSDLPSVVDLLLDDDPEVAPFADQLRGPFAEVFAEALASLSTRERNVLRLYLIDGVSAEVIGRMYKVHRATVARWIARARAQVHRETKRRLQQEVSLDHTSFESVVGLMWSGLDLSLATCLGPDQSQTK